MRALRGGVNVLTWGGDYYVTTNIITIRITCFALFINNLINNHWCYGPAWRRHLQDRKTPHKHEQLENYVGLQTWVPIENDKNTNLVQTTDCHVVYVCVDVCCPNLAMSRQRGARVCPRRLKLLVFTTSKSCHAMPCNGMAWHDTILRHSLPYPTLQY